MRGFNSLHLRQKSPCPLRGVGIFSSDVGFEPIRNAVCRWHVFRLWENPAGIRQSVTAALIQVAVNFFLCYDVKKGGKYMKLNNSMRALLAAHFVSVNDPIPENSAYPIWCKTDATGRTYWGTSSFCGLDKQPLPLDTDLSQLEWDGNEVHLDARSNAEIVNILRQALGIVFFWRRQLETKYPQIPFCIFASYDNGDMLILEEGELPTQSVALRFWADRGSESVMNFENFESWDQPAIIEYCNSARSDPQCAP